MNFANYIVLHYHEKIVLRNYRQRLNTYTHFFS